MHILLAINRYSATYVNYTLVWDELYIKIYYFTSLGLSTLYSIPKFSTDSEIQAETGSELTSSDLRKDRILLRIAFLMLYSTISAATYLRIRKIFVQREARKAQFGLLWICSFQIPFLVMNLVVNLKNFYGWESSVETKYLINFFDLFSYVLNSIVFPIFNQQIRQKYLELIQHFFCKKPSKNRIFSISLN
ncbi:unnamed protein product [Caenorhabditis angaria]|uniref:Serpentine receptor class gamma n=1 Tax=Caenorhabditis angaria TaxID=860376 RepID=A0A9P1MXA0_9PELO|nr:unnamed protein product [Caenorhabditis angaria]